jgi:hypothetical protein
MGDEGTGVSIRPFRAGDGEAFRVLNEAWIGRLFGIEEKDRSTLGDPEGNILARGGHILMAAEGEAAVGCCALILVRSGVYEVAKMTVGRAIAAADWDASCWRTPLRRPRRWARRSCIWRRTRACRMQSICTRRWGSVICRRNALRTPITCGRTCSWKWTFSRVVEAAR